MNLPWAYLGRIEYGRAYDWQLHLRELLRANPELPGFLMLLEHPPTFTVGRRDAAPFLLHSPEKLRELGFDFHASDRGGLVTYHGPGQLVGYPILRLARLGLNGPQEYVSRLEELMLGLSAAYGKVARRIEGLRGIFVGEDKIGAIGIHLAEDLSTHGFAFNINPDLGHYRYITACGLTDHGLTSLAALGVDTDVTAAAATTAKLFGEIFAVAMAAEELPPLPAKE